MAALNFEALARPLDEGDPCGPPLEDDLDFQNVTAQLEVALPSSYFRRDDEGRQVAFDRTTIDFPAAFSSLGKLIERSRDLRLLVLAAKLSILNRDLAGFGACLSAMAALVSEQWDAVHPRAEDGDFIMREVALQSLDELATVVLPLQHAPLFTSRRIGPFAFRSQLVASGETRLVEGEQHPDVGTIQAALAEADIDELAAVLERVRATRDALERMRLVWLEKVGFDHQLSFPRLTALLDQIVAFLDATVSRRAPGKAAPADAPGQASAAVATASATGANSYGPAAVSSIIHVKDTLSACLGYFREMEPSSPAVPLIAQAQQLIGKSLIEVIQIMFPEHIERAVFEIGDAVRFRLPLERLPVPDGGDGGDTYEAQEEAWSGGEEDGASEEAEEASGVGAELSDGGVPATETADRPASVASSRPVVSSRADAVAAMKAVANFYRQFEPSHPTPLLMDKACAMAQQDFMSLLGNILPDVAAARDDS